MTQCTIHEIQCRQCSRIFYADADEIECCPYCRAHALFHLRIATTPVTVQSQIVTTHTTPAIGGPYPPPGSSWPPTDD